MENGYILNRKILPQKQMKDALKVGVELKDMVALRSLIVETGNSGTVIGVEGDDLANKCPFKKTAKIVVDLPVLRPF